MLEKITVALNESTEHFSPSLHAIWRFYQLLLEKEKNGGGKFRAEWENRFSKRDITNNARFDAFYFPEAPGYGLKSIHIFQGSNEQVFGVRIYDRGDRITLSGENETNLGMLDSMWREAFDDEAFPVEVEYGSDCKYENPALVNQKSYSYS